jgi:hypothetical protein
MRRTEARDAGKNETLGALSEHASKKRQGTKSREVYRERYGDLNEVRGLGKLDFCRHRCHEREYRERK